VTTFRADLSVSASKHRRAERHASHPSSPNNRRSSCSSWIARSRQQVPRQRRSCSPRISRAAFRASRRGTWDIRVFARRRGWSQTCARTLRNDIRKSAYSVQDFAEALSFATASLIQRQRGDTTIIDATPQRQAPARCHCATRG